MARSTDSPCPLRGGLEFLAAVRRPVGGAAPTGMGSGGIFPRSWSPGRVARETGAGLATTRGWTLRSPRLGPTCPLPTRAFSRQRVRAVSRRPARRRGLETLLRRARREKGGTVGAAAGKTRPVVPPPRELNPHIQGSSAFAWHHQPTVSNREHRHGRPDPNSPRFPPKKGTGHRVGNGPPLVSLACARPP